MNPTKNQNSKNLSLKKGTRLSDRYLIQSTISISPTSTVYQARDLHFPSVQKMVVVKEFRNPSPDPQLRQANVETFERKANLLATLSHPGLPGILDPGDNSGCNSGRIIWFNPPGASHSMVNSIM
jgi:serine/threonine protein kinase